MYYRKKYNIAYSFNNGALPELILRYSGYLSAIIFSTADFKYCMGNCFSVRTSLAQTSAMILTLESWIFTAPSDFANQGGEHWEKIYINEIVVECRIAVMCLSPGRFMVLPCPFEPDTLPRETINENQIKVFSEHQTQKSQSMRGGSFSKVLSEIEVYFLLSVGVFPSVSVSVYLRSIWEELLKTQLVVAARRETLHSSKAHSESLFL